MKKIKNRNVNKSLWQAAKNITIIAYEKVTKLWFLKQIQNKIFIHNFFDPLLKKKIIMNISGINCEDTVGRFYAPPATMNRHASQVYDLIKKLSKGHEADLLSYVLFTLRESKTVGQQVMGIHNRLFFRSFFVLKLIYNTI